MHMTSETIGTSSWHRLFGRISWKLSITSFHGTTSFTNMMFIFDTCTGRIKAKQAIWCHKDLLAGQQHHCPSACHISKRSDHFITQSLGFELCIIKSYLPTWYYWFTYKGQWLPLKQVYSWTVCVMWIWGMIINEKQIYNHYFSKQLHK